MASDVRITRQQLTTPSFELTRNISAGESFKQIGEFTGQAGKIIDEQAKRNYLIQSDTMWRKRLREIEQTAAGEPEALQRELEQYHDDLMDNIPADRWANETSQRFWVNAAPYVNRAFAAKQARMDAEAEQGIYENIGVISRDMIDITPDLFSGNSNISSAASMKMQESLLRMQQVLSTNDGGGAPIFSGAQRYKILNDAKQDMLVGAAGHWFDAYPNKAKALAALQAGAATFDLQDGQGGVERVDIYKELDVRGRTEVSRLLEKKMKDYQEQQEAAAFNFDLVSGTAPIIDPKDKKTTSMLNKHYENSGIHQGFVNGDPNAVGAVASIAAQTGTLPETAVSHLRGAVVNGAPQVRANAFSSINAIEDTAPRSLINAGISEKMIAEAGVYNEAVANGMQQADALELARMSIYPQDEKEINRRKSDFESEAKSFLKDLKIDGKLPTIDPGFFSADISPAEDYYQAKYKGLLQKHYVISGSLDLAKKKAERDFQFAVGKSRVGGGVNSEVLAEFPPEKFYGHPSFIRYGNDENYKWMQKQLVKSVRDELGNDISEKDILIISDSKTRSQVEAGLKPSYAIIVNVDGIPENLGKRMIWDTNAALDKKRKKQREDVLPDVVDAPLDLRGAGP